MPKTFKILFFIIVAAIFIGTGYLVYLYFQPVKNIAKQKTDIQITDIQLLTDFNEGQKEADSIYKNKIIEMSGTVKKIEIKDSICTVIFDNGGNYIIIANCVYGDKNEVEKLKEGAKITVKGIYSGCIINDDAFMIPAEIKIDKCTLLN